MTRPRLPFRTDQPAVMRTRARLADLIYPGGLGQVGSGHVGGRPLLNGGDLQLERLAQRTAVSSSVLTQQGRLYNDMADRVAHLRGEVEARLEGEPARIWEVSSEQSRRGLAVNLGLFYGVPGIAESTGLRSAMPPAEVHAMTHVPWATGGDLGYADAIEELARRGGLDLGVGARILDFGCSSGRVIRVLAASHPQVECAGCDPNAGAIAWASDHLPGIEFSVSPQRPPLEQPAGAFDLVYAISIWSHFAAAPGLAWFAEMTRLVRPGGLLIFSTHGDQSVALRAGRGERWDGNLARAATEMYSEGFSFFPAFGDDGDWGVVDPEWGMGFMTPEWVLPRLQADWQLDQLYPGGLENDQDLYVLKRRS